MTIDASVMCNCFRDGKTTLPPVPVSHLEMDGEGYLDIKPEYETYEMMNTLYDWEQSCCEHKGMNYISEGIANRSGYRYFQAALRQVGWDKFPVLERELFDEGIAITSPQKSKEALEELKQFSQLDQIGVLIVLIDSNTRDVVMRHSRGYGGLFLRCFPDGPHVGLSDTELYVETMKSGIILFCSDSFRQYKIKRKWFSQEIKSVLWEDQATGKRFKSSSPLEVTVRNQQGDPVDKYYPEELHVETDWKLFSKDFDYIVNPLRTVFQASVETGNPVRWSR